MQHTLRRAVLLVRPGACPRWLDGRMAGGLSLVVVRPQADRPVQLVAGWLTSKTSLPAAFALIANAIKSNLICHVLLRYVTLCNKLLHQD